ncbi:MAG: hypothetical protein Q9166_006450 [cf. Caloplaca sp. 2 TL-2023]
MNPLLFTILALLPLTIASPLRPRQNIATVTITSTVTSTTTSSSSSSTPFVPIIPTAVPADLHLSLSVVTATPVADGAAVNASSTGLVPTAVPPINSSSIANAVPIIPTSVPTSNSTIDNEKCKAYCESDKISPATCLSNCHVINGQIQVDAPGLLITPLYRGPSSSTFATSTTLSISSISSSSTIPLFSNPVPGTASGTEPIIVPLVIPENLVNSVARSCQAKCLGKGNYTACVQKCQVDRFLPGPGRKMLE